MFTKIKTGRLIIIAVILILILLNPTYTNFKEFTGLSGKHAEFLHKKNNFLLFSIYENVADEKKYLGILKNFINISSPKPVQVEKEIMVDSTAVIIDTSAN